MSEKKYQIGDVVIYEGDCYGKIIDISDDKNYPYGIVFPDIYLDDRPFWAAEDELELTIDNEKIEDINCWYQREEEQIMKDIEQLNCEEMEE